VKLVYASYNHDMKDTLGHPYIGKLTLNEKFVLINMKTSLMNPRNIF